MTFSDASDDRLALPHEFIDAHHHFLDTTSNSFQTFLASLVPNTRYLPIHYFQDVVEPLNQAGIHMSASVHVECLPDNGIQEAQWVESLAPQKGYTVQAIVASCDLAASTASQELAYLSSSEYNNNMVKGIRWILDYAGPYHHGSDSATHVATTRHVTGQEDYLRGGTKGSALVAFEQGFQLLEQYGYSFDLQCAPEQLLAASELIRRHPNVPVVIDHIGKPRKLIVHGDTDAENTYSIHQQELECWRAGIQAMAALPNVFIKISMLGFCIPGWFQKSAWREEIKRLIQETVITFGPNRCMVALNWRKDAATSDSDGLSQVGPSPLELIQWLNQSCFVDYSSEERQMLFAGTAKRFYRLSGSGQQ